MLIQWKFDWHADVFFNFLFQTFQGIRQGRLGKAEVVANDMNFANDFIGVFLAHTDRCQNLSPGHGDLGSINAKRAIH